MNRTVKVVELITGPVTTITGTGNLASGLITLTQEKTAEAFVIQQNFDISNSRFYQQNVPNSCVPLPPIIPAYAGGQSSGAFLLGQMEQCAATSYLQDNLAALNRKQIPDCQKFEWPPKRFKQYAPYIPPRPAPLVLPNVGVPIPQLGPCTNVVGFPSSVALRPNPGNPLTVEQYSLYINSITPGVLPNGQQCP
jgi:hypothetical protein